MHEWALAQTVIKTALREQKKKKLKKISQIKIKIGQLQQIKPKDFKFILKEIIRLKKINLGKIEIGIERTVFKCKICQKQWFFDRIAKRLKKQERELLHHLPKAIKQYFECPHCQSRSFEIIKGRDIYLEEIK